ncbi:sugar ABC transporter ATP-binding protein [Agromyces larvae]|uniref:Sugar ABC transporter ATP-binding protein n=1 Tax=Agromyces larvae TaxID=2929802 RepID=A0ABY4BX15_9MICO|nr:sugar ABC transporter ATP-binding protein [Agromyces larvae]UOE43304.1 sugar ABC transporter ATP-binding protein [Agromyces larvae]
MTLGTIDGVRAETPAPRGTRLAVDSLSKTFGRSRVLKDISFDVRAGEVHALVGQNGSGKSTVAKILSGLYTPDPGGVVSFDGRPFDLPVTPLDARTRGMAIVHQSLGLVDEFTVLDNLRVGRLEATGPFRRVDWKRERAAAKAVFDRIHRDVPLDARVGSLNEEERAVVAIARALQDATPGNGLIIFDESTRALGRRALESFFTLLDEIVATGTAVLLITHRLEEVVDAADRVTILRDGAVVESGREVAGMTEATLTTLILGRDLIELGEHDRPAAGNGAPVRVEGVTGLGVHDIGFEIRPGEVLGLTGLAGSGYDDVPYLLAGVSPASAGSVTIPAAESTGAQASARDIRLPGLSPSDAIAAGISLIPEGREHAGIAGTLSVAENVAFPQTSRARRQLMPFSIRGERALAERWIERLDVRPPRPDVPVATLSGGNQQKVFVAKWLATDPDLLLLHEPTQAVDIGARHVIADAIRRAAADGTFVLVAGSDENELSLVCDRVLVFADGAVRQELTAPMSPDDIVGAIYADGSRAKLRQRAPLSEPSAGSHEDAPHD